MGPEEKPFVGYYKDMSLDKNTAAVYLLPLKIKLKSFLKFQGHCNTKIGEQIENYFSMFIVCWTLCERDY